MKVYIAGPMRGCPNDNRTAFDVAEVKWWESGHRPFSPAAIDAAMNRNPESPVTRDDFEHMAHMALACIHAADAIALLPGWERSVGATMELALAQFLGLDVYDAVTMEYITPTRTPWQTAHSVRGS